MRVLLLTPPLTQLNTPYPATSYLTGFLRSRGIEAVQADLSLDTALAVFSRSGLARMFNLLRESQDVRSETVKRTIDLADAYLDTIEPVVTFLQGRDPTLSVRIAVRGFLPEGPRLVAREDDRWAFGSLGTSDRAKHVASLYLDDLSDLISSTVDPLWGLSRYGERLAASAASFDPLAGALMAPPGFAMGLLATRLAELVRGPRPDLIGITVPFPGNLYGALKTAAILRSAWPGTPITLGGGYVNTELRSIQEPRLFDYVDYVTLDAGERPLLCLLDLLAGKRDIAALCRTFARVQDRVVYYDGAREPDIPLEETGTPTLVGLELGRYLSIVEVPNPMHRLWSDGRWNKLTVAHGCYWKRCAFCDVDLDYIKRYDPAPASLLVDRIEALIAETGQTGFHFVDEAAPPARLVDLAIALLARRRVVSWWGNIRFEAAFTRDVCRLLAASGCIAVSGGLETASDRLLALMDKGVTVAQAARATHHLTRAGIMVHAYLMYGFPTETPQETVDALERVRQFFARDLIQSAFWHRFTATVHSPVGRRPSTFGISIDPPPVGAFARNDVTHRDPCSGDLDALGRGLARAVYHYMHGVGVDDDVRKWFDVKMPRPKVARSAVLRAVESAEPALRDEGARLVWIGGRASVSPGAPGRGVGLAICGRTSSITVPLRLSLAVWLEAWLKAAAPSDRRGGPHPTLRDLIATFPGPGAFTEWCEGRAWRALRRAGLLIV